MFFLPFSPEPREGNGIETRTDWMEVGKRGEVGLDDLAQQGARRDGHDITSGTGNARYVGGSKRPYRVEYPKEAGRCKSGESRESR